VIEAITPFSRSTVQQFKVRVAEIPIASIFLIFKIRM